MRASSSRSGAAAAVPPRLSRTRTLQVDGHPPSVAGMHAALVGAACFGFVAAAVAGVKPPSLSKIKGPLHLLFPDQALFAPPKKDAVAPPSF